MSDAPGMIRSSLVARRTVVDIVDTGLAFCRARFQSIMGLVLAWYVPAIVFRFFCHQLGLIPFERVFNGFAFFETDSYITPNLLLMVFDGLIQTLIGASLWEEVHNRAFGTDRPVMATLESAVHDAPALIKVTAISTMVIVTGFLMCIFPGLILYAFLIFTTPIVLFEKTSSFGAVWRRSRDLLNGEWLKVAGFLALTWILLLILGLSLAFLFSAAFNVVLEQLSWMSGLIPDGNVTTMMGGVLASVLIGPLQVVFTALLYFDIRSRHEGLDLLTLMTPEEEDKTT